ncbi:MAG: phasin family protein, partial [Bradyrhizobium sp.]|uniref:phasin family protein n=1 Tax=Bradyrhizobium sp. TaxID=376 RepID=UPI0023877EEA|nr:phasin family protein [Bradyrhizobium sp.]MDE2603288.1 phasin family protein [Bradyrhizobium sp.]
MGVRSFDKAVEVQTDYARQTYANFVADSQRICGLYAELARQTFRPWMASRPG